MKEAEELMRNIGICGAFCCCLPRRRKADPRDDALSAMLRCSGIGDKAQRLACYDSAVVRVPGALHTAAAPPVACARASAAQRRAASAAAGCPAPSHGKRSNGFLDKMFGARRAQPGAADHGGAVRQREHRQWRHPRLSHAMDGDTIDAISARLVELSISAGGAMVVTWTMARCGGRSRAIRSAICSMPRPGMWRPSQRGSAAPMT